MLLILHNVFFSQVILTHQCALKYTDFKLQTIQDKDLILILENIILGGISSVMGDRYVL